jgi:hypothetical protein
MDHMGFLSKVIKSGAAKKAIDEARKPQNQQKAKSLLNKLQSKRNPPAQPQR